MHASRVFALAGIAAALLPGLSSSQDPESHQYVVGGAARSVVLGGTGACVHTGFWTADQATAACDADALKRAQAPIPAAHALAAAEPVRPSVSPQPKPAEAPAAPPSSQAPAAVLAAEPPTAQPPSPVVATVPEHHDVKSQTLEPEKQISQLDTAALPQAVHFSEDAFFDFNQSSLKPKGRALLDKLVAQLSDIKYGTILVVGHTDRIGSAKYNQTLSERRANAVRDYLVRNEIPETRIHAVGRGKGEPLTAPHECTGPVSPQVISCLQPDRRVDIEVSGTKEKE